MSDRLGLLRFPQDIVDHARLALEKKVDMGNAERKRVFFNLHCFQYQLSDESSVDLSTPTSLNLRWVLVLRFI